MKTEHAIDWRKTAAEIQDDYERVCKERDEHKRDAERYRWLRKQDCVDWDQFQYADGFEFPDEVLNDYGEMVDSAVDAAMEQTK